MFKKSPVIRTWLSCVYALVPYNYWRGWEILLLCFPSKVLESCVAGTILKHVNENDLLTEKQWACPKGHSTESLLAHLRRRNTRYKNPQLVAQHGFVASFGTMFLVFHLAWSTCRATKTLVAGRRKLLRKVERGSTLSNKFWLCCSFSINPKLATKQWPFLY